MARPPIHCRPASITCGLGGVEHERHGDLGGEAAGDLVHVGGAVAADVVDAHVETWAPSFTWSLAIATQVSQSPSSIASRNFLEPLALVRSPMMRNDGVLVERHERVDRRGAGLVLGGARARREVAARVDDGA